MDMILEINQKELEIEDEDYDVLKNEAIIKIEELTSFQGNVFEKLVLDVDELVKKFITYEQGIKTIYNYEGPINEYKILLLLNEYQAANPKLIKSKLGISNAYVHRILKELIKKGLINQIVTGLYQITEKGKNKLLGKG